MLGADRRDDAVARCDRPRRRRVHDLPAGQTDCTLAVLSRNQRSGQHIVFAHEARDKSVGWIVINLFGAADLLNPPVSKDGDAVGQGQRFTLRSEEHTSELQSLMRISYAVFCLKKKKQVKNRLRTSTITQ